MAFIGTDDFDYINVDKIFIITKMFDADSELWQIVAYLSSDREDDTILFESQDQNECDKRLEEILNNYGKVI